MIFRFQDPLFLLLLLVLPALVLRYIQEERRKKGSIRFSDITRLKAIGRSGALKLRHSVFAVRLLVLTALIVAMARPQSGRHDREVLTEGVDMILALDVSGSMEAMDFKPKTRLEAAKDVVREFIEGRESDQIGMVVFAGQSYTQCPLTLDYGILLGLLDHVQIGMIEDGTAIGTAIANCVNRLRESHAKSKVVILLTDGVNNKGEIDPITAARAAAAMDVKIYTIGVGTRGQAPFKVKDEFGTRFVWMKTEIDEESLQQIASITKAQYYRAMDERKLKSIYEEIGKLEKTKIKTREYTQYRELFGYLLWPALGLLLLEIGAANTVFRRIP